MAHPPRIFKSGRCKLAFLPGKSNGSSIWALVGRENGQTLITNGDPDQNGRAISDPAFHGYVFISSKEE